MRRVWSVLILAVTLVPLTLRGQENPPASAVLHIQQSVTTSQPNFPQFVYPYRVLDGVNSTAEARALTGTISLKNFSPNFSEVLWLLVFWEGKCPGVGGSLDNSFILFYSEQPHHLSRQGRATVPTKNCESKKKNSSPNTSESPFDKGHDSKRSPTPQAVSKRDPSSEGAKECSPPRKRWVVKRKGGQSPEGAKEMPLQR